MATPKRERELRALFTKYDLKVHDVEHTGKGHWKVWLIAPDGETKRMFVYLLFNGDTRALKNAEAELKRFARECPAPMSAMAPAIAKVKDQIKTVPAPPLRDDDPVHPDDDDGQPPARFHQPVLLPDRAPPPMPTAKELAELEALTKEADVPQPHITYKSAPKWTSTTPAPQPEPAKESSMPTPPAPTPAPKPAPAPERDSRTPPDAPPRRQLTQVQFFKVCQWAASLPEDQLEMTYRQFAEKANAAMGFYFPISSVPLVLEATGLKLRKPEPKREGRGGIPGRHNSRTEIVATYLIELMEKLGHPVSEELRHIARRQSL